MTADLSLLRRSPLGSWADALAAASTADVRLREVPFLAQLDLQVDPGSEGFARAGAALGVALPAVPNTVAVAAGDVRVLWVGPQEWLVVGPEDSSDELLRSLREALSGNESASLVDVSANRTALELSGPGAREVLEKGCSLDLHPRAFGPGQCAQTLLSKVTVVLDQVDDSPRYRLLVRGSFAAYLAEWLSDAITT